MWSKMIFSGQGASRESSAFLACFARELDGQPVLAGQVEVDVEELGSLLQGVEMHAQVREVETPEEGPFHLGSRFSAELFGIGVVP